MTAIKRFGTFWYDFVVGDDWRIAAGIAALMAITWALAEFGLNAWWLFLAGVVGLLYFTVRRAAHD